MKKQKIAQPFNPLEAEIAITALHATGDYQVLRKINLNRDTRFTHKKRTGTRIGLCLDTETTGLSHAGDKIIEHGIVAFEYEPLTGEIIRITGRYNGFEDPVQPLSKEITEITGITDDMVRGQSFNDAEINSLAAQASLVIAHNAAFDRPFVEQRFPAFKDIPWACTVSQIDWYSERLQARSLEYLLFKFGWCINAHRALDDAEGVLGLLLESLPVSGQRVFAALLKNSSESISRIYAVSAPFDKKDQLKQRGYRWSDGNGGIPKCWWTIVNESVEHDEMHWLAKEVYPDGNASSIEVKRILPVDRFSIREG